MKEYLVETYNASDQSITLPDVEKHLNKLCTDMAWKGYELVSMTQHMWYYTLVFAREATMTKGNR